MAQLTLSVEGSALPSNFSGLPQEFFEAILERMRVVFPTSQTSFVISDTEPNSNLGPWLKEGTKWYVWDEEDERYIPLDISNSTQPFVVSATAPATGDIPIWLQYVDGRAISWHLWLNDAWQPVGRNRGTTANRPDDPVEYERYFDTDIGAELFWRDGLWRTVAGVPGDTKFVSWPTLDEALEHNPGWEEAARFFEDDDIRGRALTAAHKDPGATPAASFAPASGTTARYAGERYGEERHVLTEEETPPHIHSSWDLAVQWVNPPGVGSGLTSVGGVGFVSGIDFQGHLFETGSTGDGEGHNNTQPSTARWLLVKL